jgi:polysaccharide pyruvyl transferase WcaK-like protein
VRRLLASARVVGLREPASLARVAGLGVPRHLLQQTVDDASFLTDRPGPRHPLPPSPYCLVSLARHTGGEDQDLFASRAAHLLDGFAAESGLRIVLSAHFGSIDGGPSRGDTVLHDLVRGRMSAPSDSVVVTTARHAAQLAAGADIVVTSHHHPAVFAAAAGVPVLAVAVDGSTTVRLTAALAGFGQSGVLQGADLMLGLGPDAMSLVWSDRDGIRGRAEGLIPLRRAESVAWWERVAALLEDGPRLL